MEQELNEEQKSMMQSVSKNIQGFELNPLPLHSSPRGQIFQLTHPYHQQTLVLKVIFKRQKHSGYRHEKKVHYSLKNRYVVQLENCFEDEACAYLVMEHCQKGSLRNIIGSKGLPLEAVKEYALQVAKGVHYLHRNRLVHHDISPSNILVTSENNLKVCDFGLAARCEEGKTVKGCQSTLAYAPPEAIEAHNEKFDIWSLGCLIYEMATGSAPFSFNNWKQHAAILTQSFLDNFPYSPSLPLSLVHLLRKIFTMDKEERISIDQLIKHSFFTGEPLPHSEKQVRPEERPLVVRKERSKTSMRSVESRVGRDKENSDHANRVIAKRQMPNYREILDKKVKKAEAFQKGRPSSNEGCPKTASSGFRQSKNLKPQTQSAALSRNGELSPLKTRNMKINPIRIKNTEIRIDREGITRQTLNKEQTQLINISCDGRLIKMKKGKKEKLYTFEALPSEYHNEYLECKRILGEVQAYEPEVTLTDRSFLPELALQLRIMYNRTISISLEEELTLKNLTPEQFLANTKNIKPEYFLPLRSLYLRLMEMHRM